jgi:hypothetical protein
MARILITQLPGCRSINNRVKRHLQLLQRADYLVRHNWSEIDAVARRLIREKTLSECQVKQQIEVSTLADVISSHASLELALCKVVDLFDAIAEISPHGTEGECVSPLQPDVDKAMAEFLEELRRAAEAAS